MRFHRLVNAAACTLLLSSPLVSISADPRVLNVPPAGVPRISLYQQLQQQQQQTNGASISSVNLPDTNIEVSSPSGVITLNMTHSLLWDTSVLSSNYIDALATFQSQSSSSSSSGGATINSVDADTMVATYAAATVADTTAGTQAVQQEQLLGCAQTKFFAFMNVGTQTLKVAVDTTQSSLIVASSECSQCHVTTKYNLTTNVNAQLNRQNHVGQTLDQGKSWSGFTVTDTVSMPGVKFPLSFAVMTNQTNMFASARCDGLNVTTSTPAVTADGILGLGSPSNTLPLTSSFLLTANTSIASTNFAIQLCMNTGRLWLGGSDNRFYSEVPAYTSIQKSRFNTQQSSYLITFDGVYVGGTSVDLSIDLWGDIILDSGNSGIELPPAVYIQITGLLAQHPDFISAFGGTSFFTQGMCQTPLNNKDADALNQVLPQLRFTLPAEIPTSNNPHPNATELILAPISSYIREFITPQGKIYCPGLFRGISTSTTTRLGWGFMNQFTAIFEPQAQRIGFARTFDCGAFDTTGGMGTTADAVTPPIVTTSPFPILLLLEILASTLAGLSLIAISVYCYRRHTWSSTATHMSRSNSNAIFHANPILAGALDIKKTNS